MGTAQPFRAGASVMVVFVFGLTALLFQGVGDWLVAHDSAYYWLSDHGFRFVTNCAEAFFFFGPVTSICGGVFLGMLAVAGVEFYRAYRYSGL